MYLTKGVSSFSEDSEALSVGLLHDREQNRDSIHCSSILCEDEPINSCGVPVIRFLLEAPVYT